MERKQFEMTPEDMKTILNASKPVPYMVIGGHPPPSQQEIANRAWSELGKKMGFDFMTVEPSPDGNPLHFTAIPSKT